MLLLTNWLKCKVKYNLVAGGWGGGGVGISTPEQYLEKLNFSVEFIQKKQDAIADKLAKMQGEV